MNESKTSNDSTLRTLSAEECALVFGGSNPLYTGGGTGGTNPIHRGGD